jgi:hypothetical protein
LFHSYPTPVLSDRWRDSDHPSVPKVVACAGFLSDPKASRTILTAVHQRSLSRPYQDMAVPSVVGFSPPAPAGVCDKAAFDLAWEDGDRLVVVEAKRTLRPVAALHELSRAERAWREWTSERAAVARPMQRAGRLNRHELLMVTAPPGTGKTQAGFAVLAAMLGGLLGPKRPHVLTRDELLRDSRRIDEALAVEFVRTGGRRLTWRRALELAGRVVGLGRFARRHVKAALMALIRLRAAILTCHRDRLDAVGCRGRVFLRTALRSAGTRNAPPCAGAVRPFGETGSRGVPSFLLAA